ncbi:actin nucleation-promoting factor WASL-like [Culicoides brevitarsis]|uniref:actin nucleation-promoting factor WASL-like n=1 Tax=Culicoides brevitarsis TaxID=469753 RepID=UPI00307B7ED0
MASKNKVSIEGEKLSNQPSTSLTDEENSKLFSLLGSKKITLSTAVAQIFSTEPPAHSIWIKRHTGVLCFVKDYIRKSYFLQMYCLDSEDLVWEHEMYDPFVVNHPRSYLLTFEGNDRLISLNFVEDDEALRYFECLKMQIDNRIRRSKRRGTPFNPQTNDDTYSVTLRKTKHNISTNINYATMTKPIENKTVKVTKKNVKKITKGDIGTPTGFQHLTHVGWDSYKGFEFKGDDEEVLKPFLEKAGVSEQLLNNRKTKAFILDFIQENKVIESIKSEQTLPPVPKRQSQIVLKKPNRIAPPPPPPARENKDPLIEHANNPPNFPPPPPLPPLTMTNENHQQSDERSALLESIRKGTQLKKVVDKKENNGRNDLLAEIRQGTKLRSTEDRIISNHSTLSTNEDLTHSDALAIALKKALEQRGNVMRSDSEDDSDESTDNVDEWED